MRDPGGLTVGFTYYEGHRLKDIIDPSGKKPAISVYDDNGRLIETIVTNNGVETRIAYTHNLTDRQEVVTDRAGIPTVYTYDAKGRVTSVTDHFGHATLYEYDANGNQTKVTDPLGNSTTSEYDAQNNLLSTTDALGNTTRYTYNGRGQALTTTSPLGHVTASEYNDAGNLTRSVDSLGNATTYTYDAKGNLLTTASPLGLVSENVYDASGYVTETWQYRADAPATLLSRSTFTYDSVGKQIASTVYRNIGTGQEEAITSANEYDASGKLVRAIDVYGNSTETVYDRRGLQRATRDKRGNWTHYVYDDLGQAVKTIYADDADDNDGDPRDVALDPARACPPP